MLSSISLRLVERKLRVAGRLLDYDPSSATVLIHDEADALFVDVSLCLNPVKPTPWLRDRRTVIMALGYLERSQRPLPTPILSATAPLVQVDPRLVLRAIIAQEARDLDMDLWNRAIQEQEDVSRRDTSNGQNGDPATEHDGKN